MSTSTVLIALAALTTAAGVAAAVRRSQQLVDQPQDSGSGLLPGESIDGYMLRAQTHWRIKVAEAERRLKELGDKATYDGFSDYTKCYGELGCFRSGGNFLKWPERPVSYLPAPRDKIDTRFYLYTRSNKNTYKQIKANDAASVTQSSFSKSKGTKFVVHGFMDNGKMSWLKDMKDALLEVENCNVILVDWGRGSGLPYTMATANTRLVGAEIALLINYLAKNFGLNPANVHIMGHSLGSHIAGYAGERVKGLGRITAMDPADPYFENTHPEVRIDPTDATFVDAIHTDMKPFLTSFLFTMEEGFGMAQPVGHLDFYPNGGLEQPGCDKANMISVALTDGLNNGIRHFACNHLRAYLYMTWSIKTKDKNAWEAYTCPTYDQFKEGRCVSCGRKNRDCQPLGYYAKPIPGSKEVKLYSQTTNARPFEAYSYQISMTIGGASKHGGDIYFKLYGDKGLMRSFIQVASKSPLDINQTYRYLLTTPDNLGSIQHVLFKWRCNSSLLSPLTWCTMSTLQQFVIVEKITVQRASERKCFSGDESKIKSKTEKTFSMGVTC